METNIMEKETEQSFAVIPSDALLAHWQGHRLLTRKLIEAFPESEFYSFSIGGMRPFAGLVMEMLDLARPSMKGILTGDWSSDNEFGTNGHSPAPATKQEVLTLWDSTTETINALWPQIQPQHFEKVDMAFGLYKNTNYATLLYLIDNEIHHRGQGYVYLRALGIEPPFFWDRY